MTFRTTAWGVPLALAVGMLAHVAVFGTTHAPGGVHAEGLLWPLVLSLALGLATAFAAGLSGRRRTFATSRFAGYAPLLLALAGTASFGLIELSEGRAPFGAGLAAALSAVPLAFIVLWAVRSARALAGAAGATYARFRRRPDAALPEPLRLALGRRLRAADRGLRRTPPGRGPPVLI